MQEIECKIELGLERISLSLSIRFRYRACTIGRFCVDAVQFECTLNLIYAMYSRKTDEIKRKWKPNRDL